MYEYELIHCGEENETVVKTFFSEYSDLTSKMDDLWAELVETILQETEN